MTDPYFAVENHTCFNARLGDIVKPPQITNWWWKQSSHCLSRSHGAGRQAGCPQEVATEPWWEAWPLSVTAVSHPSRKAHLFPGHLSQVKATSPFLFLDWTWAGITLPESPSAEQLNWDLLMYLRNLELVLIKEMFQIYCILYLYIEMDGKNISLGCPWASF